MDVAVLPESIAHHPLFCSRAADMTPVGSDPTAFVLPTTPETVRLAECSKASGYLSLVGAMALPAAGINAGDLLPRLASGDRPGVFIFADQLVGAVEATVLLRTEYGDFFVSPLEFIMNQRYGYRIVLWHPSAFLEVSPGCSDEASIYRRLLEHLESCNKLGDLWLARKQQSSRTPAIRLYNARRKARLFRSAVLDAYLERLEDADLKKVLGRVEMLNRHVDEGLGLIC